MKENDLTTAIDLLQKEAVKIQNKLIKEGGPDFNKLNHKYEFNKAHQLLVAAEILMNVYLTPVK